MIQKKLRLLLAESGEGETPRFFERSLRNPPVAWSWRSWKVC